MKTLSLTAPAATIAIAFADAAQEYIGHMRRAPLHMVRYDVTDHTLTPTRTCRTFPASLMNRLRPFWDADPSLGTCEATIVLHLLDEADPSPRTSFALFRTVRGYRFDSVAGQPGDGFEVPELCHAACTPDTDVRAVLFELLSPQRMECGLRSMLWAVLGSLSSDSAAWYAAPLTMMRRLLPQAEVSLRRLYGEVRFEVVHAGQSVFLEMDRHAPLPAFRADPDFRNTPDFDLTFGGQRVLQFRHEQPDTHPWTAGEGLPALRTALGLPTWTLADPFPEELLGYVLS